MGNQPSRGENGTLVTIHGADERRGQPTMLAENASVTTVREENENEPDVGDFSNLEIARNHETFPTSGESCPYMYFPTLEATTSRKQQVGCLTNHSSDDTATSQGDTNLDGKRFSHPNVEDNVDAYRCDTLCRGLGPVGILPCPQQQQQIPPSGQDYIFISHTGKDDVKQEIAHPTHWLLTKKFRKKAFLDRYDTSWGEEKMQAIAGPAYACTHALVLISPRFRDRKYCVKELNTFMFRWKKQQSSQCTSCYNNITVLLALWLTDCMDDYHEEVNNVIRIDSQSKNPAIFMIKTLWPRLFRSLNLPEQSEDELRQHLYEYVVEHIGFIPIPPDLAAYAREVNNSLLSPLSSSESEDETIFVGLAFSRIYKDEEITWNENVLKRKDQIECCLDNIACHGKVVCGRSYMTQKNSEIGAAVIRLDCTFELEGDKLKKAALTEVRNALESIAQHLREAGTTEEDLEKIMIGTLWKGSVCVLVEAPDTVLCSLFAFVGERESCFKHLGSGISITGIAPVFLVCAALKAPLLFAGDGGRDEVQLWQHSDLNIFVPLSPTARNRLCSGGVKLDQIHCFDNEIKVENSTWTANIIELYEMASAQGDAAAQTKLGWLYEKGQIGGVGPDHLKAQEWYERAAAQGDADAQFKLGWLYEKGHIGGNRPDHLKAQEWYGRATAQGDAAAQYTVAEELKASLGEKPKSQRRSESMDQIKSKTKRFFQAVGETPPTSQSQIQTIIEDDHNSDSDSDEGAEAFVNVNLGRLNEFGHIGGNRPDYLKAQEWYEKAAAQGYAQAQTKLGRLYEFGRIIGENGPDYLKAQEWYERAAAQGDADAQFKLGWLYEKGHIGGNRPDHLKAQEWYETAAAQGVGEAQTKLGLLYEFGHIGGNGPDHLKAQEWYERAAAQGVAQAQYNLGMLYEKGHIGGNRPDYLKAQEWYEKAAAQGVGEAQTKLGLLYEFGHIGGNGPDYLKAQEWYKKAAAQDDYAAQTELGVSLRKRRTAPNRW